MLNDNSSSLKLLINNNLSVFLSELQENNILPNGELKIIRLDQPNSIIWKVLISQRVFYAKYLKQRQVNPINDLSGVVKREFDALSKIYALYHPINEFNTPRPVFCSPDNLLIITEEIKGLSFIDIGNEYARRVLNKNNNAEEVCYKIGEFLKILHSSEEHPFVEDDLNQLMLYIKERVLSGHFDKNQEGVIIKSLDKLHLSVTNNINYYSNSLIHHDLNPGNILVDNNSINILDFGAMRIDHPFQDITYFRMMLNGQLGNRIKYSQKKKSLLHTAFFKGYNFDTHLRNSDPLYTLYKLKNLGIAIKTIAARAKENSNFLSSAGALKGRLVNSYDYVLIRKYILWLLSKWT